MNKLEYDLDGSGGLMPQIQALINPENNKNDVPVKVSTKGNNNNNNNNKQSHTYFKQPGRSHNHDRCDACGEGGSLICCDTCPASFHLGCYDPPLDKDNIPAGIWLCHTCSEIQKRKSKDKEQQNPINKTETTFEEFSSIILKSQSVVTQQTTNDEQETTAGNDKVGGTSSITPTISMGRNLRKHTVSRNVTNQAQQQSAAKLSAADTSAQLQPKQQQQQQQPPPPPQPVIEPIKPMTPMDILIEAANLLNPKQFELPREMTLPVLLPGDDKVEPSNKLCKRKTNTKTIKLHELDAQGLVPLPAKTCFYCRKSCKKAPLIACDYCPSYFHMDCLDPPLAALPTAMWMCPNHPENFIDYNLVTTCSLTERTKLWNRFAGPVDHETVKSDFFRKIHCKNPPFRIKIPLPQRERAKIPAMVNYHYKNPPPLLPSLRDVLRCEELYRREQQNSINNDPNIKEIFRVFLNNNNNGEISTNNTDDDNLNDEQQNIERNASTTSTTTTTTAVLSDNENKCDEKKESLRIEPINTDDTNNNNNNNNIDNDNETSSPVLLLSPNTENARKKRGRKRKAGTVEDLNQSELELKRSRLEDIHRNIDNELQNLDESIIKVLAYQRLQQILMDNPKVVEQFQNETAKKAINDTILKISTPRKLPLPSELLTKEDIERIAKQFTCPEQFHDDNPDGNQSPEIKEEQQDTILPLEQQQQQQQQQQSSIIFTGKSDLDFTEIKSEEKKCLTIANIMNEPTVRGQIKSRAVIIPVDDILNGNRWFTEFTLNGIVHMRYRTLIFGSGPNSDVNLTKYGQCANVTKRHATIFYDDITQNFELINYSEYGTEVNGQLFTCNIRDDELKCDSNNNNNNTADQINDPINESKRLHEEVKNIIDKRRGIQRIHLKVNTNARMAAPAQPICNCTNPVPIITNGWEGTALLYHGTLIRFGCISFVLAIIDNNEFN